MSNTTVPTKNSGDLLLAAEVNDMTGAINSKQDSITPSALTKVNDTNVTLTLGGTPATSLLQAVSLTLGWTGVLDELKGGTGIGSYALGDLLYSSAANTLAALGGNITTTKSFLVQTGTGSVSAAPSWDVLAASDLPTGINAAKIADGSVDNTEFQYLNGVTSAIQTQFTGKQDAITGAASTVVSSNLSNSIVVVTNGSGKLASSAITTTTLGFLDATSSIQTQLNTKTSFTWSTVSGTIQSAAVNNGYITNNAALVTVTLPSTAAVGDIVRVAYKGAGGWKVAQNASQFIVFGTVTTTTGTGGSISSSAQGDVVELLCTTTNNGWTVLSAQGNLTWV